MRFVLTALLTLSIAGVWAQSGNDVLNLLTRKGTITKEEADSLRKVYTDEQRRNDNRLDSFPLRLARNLDLSGYTQVNYLNFQQSGKINGFQIKRARLDFQGHFSSKFDYRLLIDFVGNSGANGSAPTGGALVSPLLLDAYITYKPFTWLNVKAGQQLVQFSLENLTADRNLELVERSQVVNALVARKGDSGNGLVDSIGNQNGRDLGVQVNGSLFPIGDRHFVDYYIQILNGAGIDVSDNNNAKDVDARLVFHPIKALSIGGSYYNGYDRFTSSTTKDQGRIRWGADADLELDRWNLKGEWLRGQEGYKNVTLHDGYYAQAGYFLIKHTLQAVARYDVYDANVDKANLTTTYYDFGLNYFFNVWTKFQLYYSARAEQNAHVANNLFEAQFQLAF
ncbi:porin [Dinghuibacter silviterrae]|uniref:Phosphate-selective porin n=1 Tax=Dinghuibacter silviterrae TaxID=1539049 RepID=A0A4R8DSY3_9BACT|nr:porin [Dinghuibacter silviterrae]TDX00261.1 phosphate-selective porin [Dinghuibacter silviterrae]